MLPYFYHSSAGMAGDELLLDEDNSRHLAQVLRMKAGEKIQLTNGLGALVTAVIIDDHKKKCRVRIESVTRQASPERKISIAISPLKNASRFEWFLEKATEIGVRAIFPLLAERTERQHHRPDRWQNILVSALLQSQQTWLPALSEPMTFPGLVASAKEDLRLIAHCLESQRPTDSLIAVVRTQQPTPTLILIGPEGDFSVKEVESAVAAGFIPVTLGPNRLRTETAGVVAATILCIG